MRVIADRFLERAGNVIDLATGGRVYLAVSSVAEGPAHAQWAERCEWLSALRHPAFAVLVDYGTLGDREKFEAWEVEGEWRGSLAARAHALTAAASFLDATARMSSSEMFVGLSRGRAVVVPRERDAVLVPEHQDQPAAVVVSACRRATGIESALLTGVRTAAASRFSPGRAHGDIQRGAGCAGGRSSGPPAARRGRRACRARRRTLCAAGRLCAGWRRQSRPVRCRDTRRAAHWCSSSPTPRRQDGGGCSMPLLRARRRTSWSSSGIEQCEASTPPACGSGRSASCSMRCDRARGRRRTVAVCEWRLDGRPVCWSRFERLLFRDQLASNTDDGRDWRRSRIAVSAGLPVGSQQSRAAEHAIAYGSSGGSADATGPHAIVRNAWPAPGEMTRLKHQLKIAQEGAGARGRHTVGERWLRQTVHALARRGAWVLAVDAVVCLARTVRDRGRLADVISLVDLAKPWAVTADTAAPLVSLAVLKADALFEQGRFLDAESLFDTAVSAALSSGEGVPEAVLSSVRCLFWQGRYADAWRRLALVQAEVGSTPECEIPWLVERSQVALGRGDVVTAVAAGARARDLAASVENPSLLARAFLACALAQQAAGDEGQADASAREALAVSRKAHAPLLALRARCLSAEIARRRGRRTPALLLVKRTGASSKLKLPLTVAAPLTLLRALLDSRDQTEPAVERCVDSTGLGAIRLFAPQNARSAGPSSLLTDDIVELLRCCQSAQEDAAVLTAVCGRIRERLSATGTAFYGCEQSELVCVAGDGARVDGQTARRVHTANALVLPRCGGDRIEGGSPVRYAGQVIGVLAARWTAAASWCDADVSLLLTTGAAAAAPALAGALARRAAARVPRAADVLGVSRAIRRCPLGARTSSRSAFSRADPG